jgi:hypothetical protein
MEPALCLVTLAGRAGNPVLRFVSTSARQRAHRGSPPPLARAPSQRGVPVQAPPGLDPQAPGGAPAPGFRWRRSSNGGRGRAHFPPSASETPAHPPSIIDLCHLDGLGRRGPRLRRPGRHPGADEPPALTHRLGRGAAHIRGTVAALPGLDPEGDLLRHVGSVETFGAAVVEVASPERHPDGCEDGERNQSRGPVAPAPAPGSWRRRRRRRPRIHRPGRFLGRRPTPAGHHPRVPASGSRLPPTAVRPLPARDEPEWWR